MFEELNIVQSVDVEEDVSRDEPARISDVENERADMTC